MTFRSLFAFAMLIPTTTVRAADCVSVMEQNDEHGRPSAYASVIGNACGRLKIVDKRRDDPRERVNIFATYAIFDLPRSAAERRYNEWIGQRPAGMNFSGAIELTTDGNRHDTMVGTLYRSPRLLSAATRNWVCCGAHGSAWSTAFNIDAATGRDVRLDELVGVTAAADFCWRYLAQRTQDDFATGRGPPEFFAGNLRSGTWSVVEAGLLFDFGYMWGYAGGYFTCEIKTKDLRRITKAGVAVPF